MRFLLEVVAAVRDVWPRRGKALGVRINGSDWHPRGLTLDDAVAYARALREAGVDYVCTSGGNGAPDVVFPAQTPGYMVPYAERVRAEAAVPTMAVGMILLPEQAEEVVAAGRANMVGIARGALDDPRWPWHAANALGQDGSYPPQYRWARPKGRRGYDLVHPRGGRAPAG